MDQIDSTTGEVRPISWPVTVPPAKLAAKLLRIMKDVEAVPKSGFNAHFQYHFRREQDVLDAVRKALLAHHVMLLTSCVAAAHDMVRKTDKGTIEIRDEVWISGVFVDAESGEAWITYWPGAANDTGDKGVYKAITGGMKYMLTKVLLLGDGNDPENAERPRRSKQQAQSNEQGQQQEGQQQPARKAASEKQLTKLRALMKYPVFTPEQQKRTEAMIAAGISVTKASEMMQAALVRIKGAADSTPAPNGGQGPQQSERTPVASGPFGADDGDDDDLPF